mgnify:CR=1 FL=1
MRKITQLSAHGSICAAIVFTATVVALVTPVVADDSWDGTHGRPASMILLEERIAAGDLKYHDPRTGEVVVADYSRVALLRQELAPLFGGPVTVERSVAADGTVRASANGAVNDVYLVRTNLDGTRVRGCFRDLDAAVAFIVGLDEDLKRHTAEEPRVSVVD